MPFDHKLTPEEEVAVMAEVESVLAAIRELGPDPDLAEIRKLYSSIGAETPTELTYEPLEEPA